MMVLCAGLLVGCDKELEKPEILVPPVENPEEPEEPTTPLSTDDIIKTKIGDTNMIVGSNDWNAVAYGNGKYVAVGQSGYIAYSSDGINWSIPKQIGQSTWKNIMFENGIFLSISNSNLISLSTDGINWTTPTSIGITINGVGHGNGTFAVIGYNGNILVSTNGTTWTSGGKAGPNISGLGISDKWIIGCTSGGVLYRSNNGGKTWKSTNGGVNVDKIEFGNNIFVGVSQYDGVGYCLNSAYLETFYETSLNSSMKWNDVTFGNGKFVILSISGYVSTSADGKNWSTPEQIKDESGKVVTATLNGVCAMP